MSASSSEFRPIGDEEMAATSEGGEQSSPEGGPSPATAAAEEVAATTPATTPALPGSKQQQRRRRRRPIMKKKQQPAQGAPRKGGAGPQPGEASDTSSSAAWESALSLRLPEQSPTCAQPPSPIDDDDDLAKIQNASTEADFHFFSDTEILPRR